MAQSLDQIIGELDAAYNPSRQAINARIDGLRGAQQADIAGLEAQKTQSFDDITNGARSRGIGFSGIPLQEQAKYTASAFLPAVAKVKQSYNDSRSSLVEALNGMNMDQRKTAMGIRESQSNRDFEAEQARLARDASTRAAAAANAGTNAMSSLFNQQQTTQNNSGFPEGMQPRTDKLGKFTGFNFNVGGKSASAAQFAKANKLPLGDVLYKMAESGDQTATQAYKWMQSIQGSQMFKTGAYKNTPAYKKYSSLFWGA